MPHSIVRRNAGLLTLSLVFWIPCVVAQDGPQISPGHTDALKIEDLGATYYSSSPAASQAQIGQLAIGPGPNPDKVYLYAASMSRNLIRYTYDPVAGTLSEQAKNIIATRPNLPANIAGHGIAFHGNTMYLTRQRTVSGSGASAVKIADIYRLTDEDRDGLWGEAENTSTGQIEETYVAIVVGVPVGEHQMNQLQIHGDTLYVSIGSASLDGITLLNTNPKTQSNYGESAYTGTIAYIPDLTQVPSTIGAASFPSYLASPNATQYNAIVKGTAEGSELPYTSSVSDKLRIHSSGARNPFGIAIDLDGQLYMTNNFQRADNDTFNRKDLTVSTTADNLSSPMSNDIHDQFFKAVFKADYGYRNANWQVRQDIQNAGFFSGMTNVSNVTPSITFDNYANGSPLDNDAAHPAYNILHDPANPVGLGPHCSANGFDFYKGRKFPVSYRGKAFVSRWTGTVSIETESVHYRDIVAVDPQNGAVTRIAHNLKNPLDVLYDGHGHLLVAEYSGSILRISSIEDHDNESEPPQITTNKVILSGSAQSPDNAIISVKVNEVESLNPDGSSWQREVNVPAGGTQVQIRVENQQGNASTQLVKIEP